MATKKVKKRVSNGISTLHGNKDLKGDEKSVSIPNPVAAAHKSGNEQKAEKAGEKKEKAPEQKKQERAPLAKEDVGNTPVIITITRHHYPTLKSVLGNQAFYTADGRELRNLLDMAYAFEEMAEDTFRHHVGEGHNHFSNWLKDCFELEALSQSIKNATKQEAHSKVIRHVLHELLK